MQNEKHRKFDEVYGDENSAIIREHKHIKGKVDTDQFNDNIQIVQYNINPENQNKPLMLEKDSNRYRPNKLVYTFATPGGVRANRKWMYEELEANKQFLSFEIINSKGERKIVKYKNIKDLDEPTLSQWLDSSSANNLKTNP